ncbi:c-type cytochrome domain-containing protein [Tundrisphaera lichenicola]|uniref:c-type cytochrome domain-containing protein n=1 Tax=Tundrisphaera lichenicola TaxID=2029860 RepID=UPI003EBC77C5
MTLPLAIPLILLAMADDAPVSYSREVAPFLEEHCLACHDEGFTTSDLSMADVESMKRGGRRGPSLVPGSGKESLIVQFMDGTRQPQMPPKTSIPRDQIAVLARWIDQGARVDAEAVDARRQERRKLEAEEAATFASDAPPSVTGLAYSPDGKALAVASYREIILLDPATGKMLRKLAGFPDQVTSVAYASDGSIAGAGGTPGRGGEVRIWDGAGRERQVLRGHADTILAVAWRPGSEQVATSSLDKVITIWDVPTGHPIRSIKNHADIVTSLAFSPDGKKLASGSADRTAKIHDPETGLQLASLAAHKDAVLAIAFSPDGQYLATAGADNSIQDWKLADTTNPEKGFGHTGPVYALAWRPDGSGLFAGSGGRPSFLSYRKENGNRVVEIKEETMPRDWVYATAIAPDNTTVAAGGWDGSVIIWDLKDGARVRTFVPGREE